MLSGHRGAIVLQLAQAPQPHTHTRLGEWTASDSIRAEKQRNQIQIETQLALKEKKTGWLIQ